MSEPVLDLSEIMDMYKADAKRMVGDMRTLMEQWPEITQGGSEARAALRKAAHQLRGSGRTYGFRDVTRLCKAIENIVVKLEKGTVPGTDNVRASIAQKLDRLSTIF